MLIEVVKLESIVETIPDNPVILAELYNHFSGSDLTDFIAIREETRAIKQEAEQVVENTNSILIQIVTEVINTQTIVVNHHGFS